ncbi:hypothetical protein BJ878DRAFT_101328 [Calycina marina]|uniref:Uncharacterized protein n=1 Tax=Calycina marina TaxID=1763456 RepID=A0A9P7Z1G6_9HELO|nr:hypothetical protein BJ878DRAFT_101328 [Calycina marina]
MAEFHRKIELQSIDDLQYLITNVRRSARTIIDKDLPPMPNMEKDPMRQRVEILVQDYISRVFLATGDNITINGMPPSPTTLEQMLSGELEGVRSVEEFEAFDPRLWERAKELAGQEEEMVEEIAGLRKGVPGKVVEGARRAGEGDDEEVLAKWVENARKGDDGELGIGALERQEAVKRDWIKGVEGLGRLKRGLPEMAATNDRAEKAEAYVLTAR